MVLVFGAEPRGVGVRPAERAWGLPAERAHRGGAAIAMFEV